MMNTRAEAPQHPTVAHYDLDVSFFESFLDPYLKYTSGFYTSEHDLLEVATARMLRHLIAKATLPRQSRILEIGSGWGSLIRMLRELNADMEYVGVSPSIVQNDYIQRTMGSGVTLLQSDFEGLDCSALGQFDAIFLIGSFCHLQEKQDQLRRMASLLQPNGRIVIEDSFFLSESLYQKHAQDARTEFLQKSVFGYSEIPSLATFTNFVRQAGLKVESLEDQTESYSLTIASWLKRLEQAPKRYRALSEMFEKYLKIAQAGWNYTTGNHVVVLRPMPARKARGMS